MTLLGKSSGNVFAYCLRFRAGKKGKEGIAEEERLLTEGNKTTSMINY